MTAPGLVVVGSGPGGMEAVRAFRDADPDPPVIMVTADPDLPYNRPTSAALPTFRASRRLTRLGGRLPTPVVRLDAANVGAVG